MEYEPVSKRPSSTAVYILPNIIIYLKAIKYLNVRLRQAYKLDLEWKIRVQKIEDQILYYGCRDSELLCWKLETFW